MLHECRYNFNNPVFARMYLFSPKTALSHKEREKTPSLHTLACLLPRCVAKNEIQVVDDEWRRLPLETENLPHEVRNTSEPDQFWHKVLF